MNDLEIKVKGHIVIQLYHTVVQTRDQSVEWLIPT